MNKFVFIPLVALIVLGLSVFFLTRSNNSSVIAPTLSNNATSSTVSSEATSAPISIATPATTDTGNDSRLYSNASFHFSLQYPNVLSAKEYQEQGGALTVSFQDANTNQGFEVYVTPYTGTHIDQARFKLDEPSGTYLEPVNVVIDGTQGTMFFGKNAIMGDTREVWFIHEGYLYEVTTYKELDQWLGTIMKNWRFI